MSNDEKTKIKPKEKKEKGHYKNRSCFDYYLNDRFNWQTNKKAGELVFINGKSKHRVATKVCNNAENCTNWDNFFKKSKDGGASKEVNSRQTNM